MLYVKYIFLNCFTLPFLGLKLMIIESVLPAIEAINPGTGKYYTTEKNGSKLLSQINAFTGKEAFFLSRERAELFIRRQLLFLRGKSYRITKYCPVPMSMCVELQPRSPYRRIFDKFLLRTVQAGLPVRLKFTLLKNKLTINFYFYVS